MQFEVKSPDAQGRIDPPLQNLLRHLPRDGGKRVTIVPITRLDDFRFNLSINGPWVLWDHSEFGWDWKQHTSYRWGVDRLDHEWFKSDEYRRFDDFVVNHPPIMTFQRELLAADATDTLIPIEYGNWLPRTPIDSPERFRRRPIEVLHNGGRSHEGRMTLFGAIFQGASRHGYDVITRWEDIRPALADSNSRKWANIHCPHYSRIDVRDVDRWNNQSKLSVSMPGCGRKCFRHSEAINGSIMAFQEDQLAWSYPYVDGVNCVRFVDFETDPTTASFAVNKLNSVVEMEPHAIYSLYVRAQEQADKYRCERYAHDWIAGNVEKAL